jgi:hypothetical protein
MSTRSHIVIEAENGVFHYRYHHSDGYVNGLGETLFKNFKKLEDIESLFDMGQNFSTINSTIAYEKKWDKFYSKNGTASDRNDRYTLTPMGNLIIKSYPEDKPAKIKKQTFKKFKDVFKYCGEEFVYVLPYGSKKWIVSDHGSDFIPLTVALKAARPAKEMYHVEWYEGYKKKVPNFAQKLEKKKLRCGKVCSEFLNLYDNATKEAKEKLHNFIGKSVYDPKGHLTSLESMRKFAQEYNNRSQFKI